jgi:hypothetical protein
MTFLDANNILYTNQHGFRSKLSCETQLIQFIQDLQDTINVGKQTDVIIMDFSKAFDKVDHQRLLLKLNRIGDVLSGVPQGSVLGPCLFLIYINDMPIYIVSNIRLFADYTIAYLTITSSEDCQVLQTDFDKLQEWEEEWLMSQKM